MGCNHPVGRIYAARGDPVRKKSVPTGSFKLINVYLRYELTPTMQKLTKAQEELMHYVWEIGEEVTVGQLRERISAKTGKLPAHSTISTLILALDERGFVTHRQYGRTFVYTPAIIREAYGRQRLQRLVQRFFGGSATAAVSYLVKDENLSLDELNRLVHQLEEE